jgi:hypothetical protein
MLIQVISFGNSGLGSAVQLVPDNSQVLQQSERSLGEKAREGVFMVQRLNTIAPSWLTAGNTNRYAAGSYGLYQCYGYYPYANGGIFQPFQENAKVGLPPDQLSPLLDTLWSSDMTFGWIRFSGLSLNPQSGNNTTQLIIKKVYTGYEVQPSIRSAWSGMVQLSPKPDLEAMQALMDAFYELKDAMPARYNFLGTLAKSAADGLKTFGSSVLKNLMEPESKKAKGRQSNPDRKPKNKQKAEVKDIDRQVHSLTKKFDRVMPRSKSNGRSNNNRSQPRNRSVSSRRVRVVEPVKEPKRNNKKSKKIVTRF